MYHEFNEKEKHNSLIKEEKKNVARCPYCNKLITDFCSFDYLPYCHWECEEKSKEFDKTWSDMLDGFVTG